MIVAEIAILGWASVKTLSGSDIGIRIKADTAALTGGTTGVATATGVLEWVNTYAPALGFIVSVFSGVVAAVFYWLNYSLNRDKRMEEMREEIMKELEREGR